MSKFSKIDIFHRKRKYSEFFTIRREKHLKNIEKTEERKENV